MAERRQAVGGGRESLPRLMDELAATETELAGLLDDESSTAQGVHEAVWRMIEILQSIEWHHSRVKKGM